MCIRDRYGSVESLIENVGELKGALQKKVSENIDQIKFSKFLATIKTDVPVDISVHDLHRQPQDTEALKSIFKELEFKTFLARLSGAEAEEEKPAEKPQPKNQDNGTPSLFDFLEQEEAKAASVTISAIGSDTVTIVNNADLLAKFKGKVQSVKEIGMATYSIGVEAMRAVLKGIAIAVSDTEIYYICLLYTSPSPRDRTRSRMPSSA